MKNSKTKQAWKKGKEDLYFFAKEIIGYNRMTPIPHRELCNHLMNKKFKRKLNLMPRGSFKSSITTVAGAIFTLLHDPNARILIAGETQKNSMKFVKEAKSHYEMNLKFRSLYGDWISKDNTWRDNEFIVNRRTKVKKEPSIMASSLEKGTIVGLHFDLIILDDVVSPNNISTNNQIEKTLEYYKALVSVLDPGAEIWISGTRWSIFDLYGWILDEDNGQRDRFSIIEKEACDEKFENLLMPNVLNKDFLIDAKSTQGPTMFNMQYRNIALSNETATFREDQVKYYDPKKQPKNLIYFMTVDPAVSQSLKSDFSGIIVNGVDYDHNWWIQEALSERLDPYALIDRIFELVNKYQPMMCVAMEKYVIEKFLQVSLNAEMEYRDIFFPIKEIPTNNRISKEIRIKGLQPKFERGEIFLRKEHTELSFQIIYFPQLKNDDVLDALKSQLQITFPCDTKDTEPIQDSGLPKLTQNERMVWDGLKKLKTRKVKQTKWLKF